MTKPLMILLSGALLAVIVFLIVLFDTDAFVAFLNKHNLLPQPERFTELYFEDHENLPKHIEATQEAEFKYTVHNLEYEPFTYEYKVEAISTQEAKLVDEGTFTLQHDEYKTMGGNISTEEAKIRTKITISLENKNQSIHFWVNSN